MSNNFQKGDEVSVEYHVGAKPLIGIVKEAVAFSQYTRTTFYIVDLHTPYKRTIKTMSSALKLLHRKDYDGNEVGNFADIRHIWRPNK